MGLLLFEKTAGKPLGDRYAVFVLPQCINQQTLKDSIEKHGGKALINPCPGAIRLGYASAPWTFGQPVVYIRQTNW
jgi:hypothetical protein